MDYVPGGSDISAEFECVICTRSYQEPVRPSCCAHVFCRSCLTQSLSIRQHCPLCRIAASQHVIPANDVLRLMGASADASRARRNEMRNQVRLGGWTLPALDWFSTAPSAGIQDRVRRLRASMEESGQSARHAAPTLPPRHALFTGLSRTSVLSDAPQPGPLWAPTPPSWGGASAPQGHLSSILSSSSSDEEFLGLAVSCPYCQEGALNELDLLEHCNANHRADSRPVVCPICVALPHGDPTYYSRNFIGHLNLRHRYYTQDIVEVSQTDTINEQAAILASWNTLA